MCLSRSNFCTYAFGSNAPLFILSVDEGDDDDDDDNDTLDEERSLFESLMS